MTDARKSVSLFREARTAQRTSWLHTWAETFGYLEHVERERDRVDDVHSYDTGDEHPHDRIVEATHRDGPVQRRQHPVYRPAYEHRELDVAVNVQTRYLQDHREDEDRQHGYQVESLQLLRRVS